MFSNRRQSTRLAGAWQSQLLYGAQRISSGDRNKNPYSLWWMKGIVWVFVLVFLGRLVELQLVQGNYHRQRAEENRLVTWRLAASRGVIRDRTGEVLTRNVPTYKRLVPGTTLFQGRFESLDREEAISLTQEGQWVFFDISREYLYGRALSPVVGYIAQADQTDLDVLGGAYIAGDLIGKTGIEKSMEQILRGSPGFDYMEVNSSGKTIRTEGRVEPQAGADVVLTIDRRLSQYIYEAMDGYIGAGVALDPQTGEILALVSRPAFDPNDIPLSLKEEDKPFFNRAISGAYPPGSIYKIVTLTAGLEEGVMTPTQTIEDTGEILINGFRFGNWLFDRTGGTEGLVDAVKAMQRSNDIYFYKLGEAIGVEKLAQWSRYFGMGSLTGLPLAGEVAGLVPDPIWKERLTGDRWYLGNTYHMSIGQGDLQATPLQMALVTSVVANQGRLCAPKLVVDDKRAECQELGISTENLQVLADGMKAVCLPGGTASRWASFSPQVACKTGTAQFGGVENNKTHSWFTVFAPADTPEIVLTILLEGAGEGSEHASPVAMKVLEQWFLQQK